MELFNRIFSAEEYFSMDLPPKAELIDGKIETDMSASPNKKHQDISIGLSAEIWYYIKHNNGKCKVYTAPFDVKLTEKDVVQPDIFIVCNSDIITDSRVDGTPDWIAEILSPSSVANDWYYKRELYQQLGVKEYWIIDPMKEKVTVYINGSNNTGVYTFDDDIPISIYDGKIKVCIRNLL